ncbi:hypothetical protein BH23ACT3_BH23ACT3_03170 [soil metagenome]
MRGGGTRRCHWLHTTISEYSTENVFAITKGHASHGASVLSEVHIHGT